MGQAARNLENIVAVLTYIFHDSCFQTSEKLAQETCDRKIAHYDSLLDALNSLMAAKKFTHAQRIVHYIQYSRLTM